ncbi:hypothetical protein SuUB63_21900 [Streptococcus uberis]
MGTDVMTILEALGVDTIHVMTVGEAVLVVVEQEVITVLCWHANWIVHTKKRSIETIPIVYSWVI